jgi:hypothetical protein
VIPVAAVATKRLPMVPGLGWLLAALGVFLTVGALSIIRTAAAESTLPPGEEPDTRRLWRGRTASAVAAVVLGALLFGGWTWWNGVDGQYARRLYRPLHATANVRAIDAGRVLRLAIDDARWERRESSPLVPDHGKMMHLFLVQSPGMAALAHLHPAMVDSATFAAALGNVPAGHYRFYADVVHESGFAETLTGQVDVPPADRAGATADPDDAVWTNQTARGDTVALDAATWLVWHRPKALVAQADAPLEFSVVDTAGAPVALEPYLGMPGHTLVSRDDGAVFMHLHSGGSFSMASQQVLEAIQRGDTLPSVRLEASPRPIVRQDDQAMAMPAAPHWRGDRLSFPFAFPTAGRYRIWIQVRRNGIVRTGAFDATVAPTASK